MFKKLQLSYYYYIFVFIGYILTLFIPGFRPGVFGTILMILLLADTCYFGFANIKEGQGVGFDLQTVKRHFGLVDIVILVYFIYNIASVIWLTGYGYPVSVFAGEFVCSVLPVVFYFVALSERNSREAFYRVFLYGIVLLGVISILLYVIAPQFYCDYLYEWSMISKADASTARVRMESVTGSTNLSYLGVAGICISSFFIFTNDLKENGIKFFLGKTRIVLSSFILLFSFVLTFMANGRAGMVAALLVLVYLNFLLVFKLKYVSIKVFYAEIAIVVLALLALCVLTPGIASKFAARLVSLPGAVGQRSEQWIAAANNMKGAWLGNGLGANGHKAIGIEGSHVVADGGLVKLFCEEGSVGFGLFIYAIMSLFIKGYKRINKVYAEIAVVGTALLMSIGSNIIAFQLCAPIFWYALGVISKETREDDACTKSEEVQ